MKTGKHKKNIDIKYYEKGWENFQRAWLDKDKEAKNKEIEEWWK